MSESAKRRARHKAKRLAAGGALVAASVIAFLVGSGNLALAQGWHHGKGWHQTDCVDATGRRAVLAARNVSNTAMAGRFADGTPFIVYNPTSIRRLHRLTRTFVYYHECAHHVLGHTTGHRPTTREIDADCWAIRQMARRRGVDAGTLQHIQRDVAAWPGSRVHLPGPRRAANLAVCLNGRTGPGPQAKTGRPAGKGGHYPRKPGV